MNEVKICVPIMDCKFLSDITNFDYNINTITMDINLVK